MTWHDDLKRIADALDRAYPVTRSEEYGMILTDRLVNKLSGQPASPGDPNAVWEPTVTPSWDTDEDQLADIEAENEVIEPVCTHPRQNLRSNGDVGCADCPQVIIPKTGFNATGGPNLEAK